MSDKSDVVSVRFSPVTVAAARRRAGATRVSTWIRRLVEREVARDESVTVTLDDGKIAVLPADALREICAALTPLVLERGSVSLTFGRPQPALSVVPVDGMHTFSCPHLSVGPVASADCGLCGPLGLTA